MHNWAGQVTSMGKKRHAHRFCVGNLKEKHHLEGQDAQGLI